MSPGRCLACPWWRKGTGCGQQEGNSGPGSSGGSGDDTRLLQTQAASGPLGDSEREEQRTHPD